MATSPREVTRPVDPLILERWSPRAFDGSAIPQADIDTLFDAALFRLATLTGRRRSGRW